MLPNCSNAASRPGCQLSGRRRQHAGDRHGFSCKTQIKQADTGRRALHVSQVIKMAREYGLDGFRAGPPERASGATIAAMKGRR
jgi:hypothetical protein